MKKKKDTKKIIKAKVKKTNEEKFEKWITDKTEEILNRIMLIPFCKIDYRFYYKDNNQPCDNNLNITFSINYQHSYKRALLIIHPVAYNLWKRNEKEDLINCIIHEICHIHTIPLVELAKQRFVSNKEITNASEELTETIAEYIRGIVSITSDIYDN